jgi:branched-chain amino acid transport system permease protein
MPPRLLSTLVAAAALITLPFWAGDQYQLHIAALIGGYWVLIAGLNLVVGFSGQLSVGHVGLLAIGAYAFAIIAGTHGVDPWLALAASGGIGALCGFLLGLPSLRLPGFYFAMATLAFALIVTELVLAFEGLTGGGVGLSVPGFPAPFDTPEGNYWLILGVAAFVTWLTWNVARLMWGRGLIAVRDSVVTAQAVGVPVLHAKLGAFVFSGLTAGLGGALFAVIQSYITPDTFLFELGMFFFVCIIIGGRGSLIGPFLGTVVLTALPELSAPLAKLGNFFYGLLLLLVVLLLPEGIGRLFQIVMERLRPRRLESVPIAPQPERLAAAIKVGQR